MPTRKRNGGTGNKGGKANAKSKPTAKVASKSDNQSMTRSLLVTIFFFTIITGLHCIMRYTSLESNVCHIEGPLLSNSICNNFATKKAPGALYQIEKDEFACHPFKPTGTVKPTFAFYDKMYIGNPHDHPRAKIDFVLSRAETFLGGMKIKIKNQSSDVITPWTGKSIASSSVNNFVKAYMWVYNKIKKFTGGESRTIKRIWSEETTDESFKFFYFKHPKSNSCQREP